MTKSSQIEWAWDYTKKFQMFKQFLYGKIIIDVIIFVLVNCPDPLQWGGD